MLTTEQKIAHLKSLGFDGDMSQIKNFYNQKPFDKNDRNVKELIRFSHSLWKEYSNALQSLSRAKSSTERSFLDKRIENLINIAIPDHGIIANLCDGFYATVGAIDHEKNFITSINKNVTLGDYTLLRLEDYALIGENVNFGNRYFDCNVPENKQIVLEKDTWICSNCVIGSGARIKDGTVLAIGAVVRPNSTTQENSLSVGNPATTKYTINKNQPIKEKEQPRSKEEIDFIVNHINLLGIKVDDEFIRLLNGENFNCFSKTVSEVTQFSHELSYEYNNPLITEQRRKEILDILFPIQGKNFSVGRGLFVDILGIAKVGNNVKIGDNSFFAGNITIGNNVKIGNNVTFAGIGHELEKQNRHLRDYNGIFGEVCVIDNIKINSGLEIGNNCTFAPNSHLTQDLNSYTILLANGKTIQDPTKPNDFMEEMIK